MRQQEPHDPRTGASLAASASARWAAGAFRTAGARTVLVLGAGHGPDAAFLARAGLTVRTAELRVPLPLPDAGVDAVFAPLVLCAVPTTREMRAAVDEIGRVLRPGGLLVYTVRHTGDPHFRTGVHRGGTVYEHGGVAVHFFDADLLHALSRGWHVHGVQAFEEGELPYRLWRVTQAR
ncbi:class I SAM-dependent methyltransferase [Streptomyces sp. NPDC057616]|uniref:class I SAM-dependent methyltransferase n=1 Tax=Streptomyces sp. NPDC057616 TaxID=3346183 RepID=UPI0036903517